MTNVCHPDHGEGPIGTNMCHPNCGQMPIGTDSEMPPLAHPHYVLNQTTKHNVELRLKNTEIFLKTPDGA